MKTYTIIKGFFAVGVLSVVLSGCSEDAMDRINKDHGHTQSVAGRFILTDVITSTAFSNAGGDLNTSIRIAMGAVQRPDEAPPPSPLS